MFIGIFKLRCSVNEEEKLFKKLVKKETPENMQEYEKATSKTDVSVKTYDTLSLLYLWIIELLSIGGYFYHERVDLFGFIITEIEKLPIQNGYLDKAVKFLKENLYDILQFVRKAEVLMQKLAVEENIPIEIVKKMWEQLRYSSESAKYNYLEAEIGLVLGLRYDERAINSFFSGCLFIAILKL